MRLVLAAAALAVSLLCVVAAPTYTLWKLSVLATEWGHLLAPLPLLTLVPGWRSTRRGRTAAVVGGIAALLFLTPLLRALPRAERLPDELRRAFGEATRLDRARDPLRLRPLLPRFPRSAATVGTHTYTIRDGTPLRLDVYRGGPGGSPRPVVLVIHGGSWSGGARTQLPALNHYLARRGYLVAAMEYRLAPTHPFPAAAEDVAAAVAYLKQHAAGLGADPQRFVLLGRSAGGQLALLHAAARRDPAVRGAVSLYGPTDLRFGYEHPSNPAVLDSRSVLERYLGGSPREVPDQYDAASPIRFAAGAPPVLMIHGGRDELVRIRHAQRMAAMLSRNGRPHLLLELPWATHGCDVNLGGPCGQLSTYAIEHFLAAVTR